MGRTCQRSNNEASSGRKKDNKRSGVKQKGQQKVAGGDTKSIHDNPSTKDNIKLLQQLSEGVVPTRQIQTTKRRSVTCNRVSGKTKRVQNNAGCARNKESNKKCLSMRMHMEFRFNYRLRVQLVVFDRSRVLDLSMQRRSST